MNSDPRTVRSACVRVADWPIITAWNAEPSRRDTAFAVLERVGPRELVRAASPAARALGVVPGLRKREAEARGVDQFVEADLSGEARRFEVVARACETVTPRLTIDTPGRLGFPTRGPARYFGGDLALGEHVHAIVGAVLGDDAGSVRVGIADGSFAARLAAREARHHDGCLVVVPGSSARFLAPFPLAALGDADFAGLLERLGIHTLGDFANLPSADVLARFGPLGATRHALARGLDPAPVDLSVPPPDLVERHEFDPPVTRVDTAACAATALADRLLAALARRGLGCVRVRVEAETEHGEQLVRVWRHEGALSATALAERVRWQLDAWLDANERGTRIVDGDVRAEQDLAVLSEMGVDSTTGALVMLRLVPEEVVASGERQMGLWGGDAAAAERADRVLGRLQGMLGIDQVGTFVVQGGRTPAERVAFVPWGEPREPRRPLHLGGEVAVWPGRLPDPAPTQVFDPPSPAELLDRDGYPVVVNGRGELRRPPAWLRAAAVPDGGGAVRGWCGPWIHDVRWWDIRQRHRRALFQITIGDDTAETACLVSIEHGRAHLDGVY